MHLRGTHCGRSDGKTQISRAQSRWNNGTAKEEEELPVEATIAGAFSGSVHATSLGIIAVKLTDVLMETDAAGRGIESGADCFTQQQAFLGTQHPHGTGVGAEVVSADATT
ncbi:MAG: hypothetical protein HOP33_05630 [Verrucomicrobia bacterium]|nr:hypothetical protein [Verrucomicrobiota bacterium]